MVGNTETAAAIDRELPDRVYRYVNDQDPVPLLPTLSLLANEYSHSQKEIALGVAAAAAGGAITAAAFFQEWGGKTADGIMQGTLIDDVWKSLQDRIGAHAMENYRSRITELFKKE
jgi:triacylglycerol lipase